MQLEKALAVEAICSAGTQEQAGQRKIFSLIYVMVTIANLL